MNIQQIKKNISFSLRTTGKCRTSGNVIIAVWAFG